ncbi:metallophosphoesterase [Corallococcus macrosporus]|uniref:Metallophosphatase n=2 Tax=Myxococcaceae TaxID=31 RepID=A0A250K149_9BACT|nr:metallophosphoesterase [Corallococcus macrosporus]AEI68855.1 metallophosphoesterase [Corallococcus macrosporus]ATB49620.1 metallophosphatase [Corallococcus macrosporus DSM 14697]
MAPSLLRSSSLLVLVPLLLAAAPAPKAPAPPRLEDTLPDTFSGVERVVAVGDVHGDVDALKEVLRLAGIIDAKDRWIGGKTHLVQTGDIPDRGDQTRAAFDLLMRLEQEALAAGGRVHALLGNHEAMNMLGDLRYVSPGEMASFADQSPEADSAGSPPGLNGHRVAYSLQGRYGQWLRRHAAVVRINDTLFVHGGVAPGVPGTDLSALNRWVRQDFFPGQPPGGARNPQGPLWFRGYALGEEQEAGPALDAVLQRYGARRMVMGHTTNRDGKVKVRFNGKALLIDTGLSTGYGRNLAALELRGGKVNALYREGPVTLATVETPAAAPRPAAPKPRKK